MHLPPWNVIEEDVRIGFVLMADACRYMLGMGERGNAAAAAILGMQEVPPDHLDDRIEDPEFLRGVAIAGTQFVVSARRCYDFVTIRGPIESINVEDERAEGLNSLSYFLSFMPREAMGGLDFTPTFSRPDAPLVVLLEAAEARLELAEFVHNLVRYGEMGLGFTPRTIAILGDVNLRSVRNVMGPKGDKPIRSNASSAEGTERTELVLGDPLDALEWLAGRRGFNPGRLSPEWVSEHLEGFATLPAAGALPGIVSWLNRVTTGELAEAVGWPVDRVRDWTRARNMDAERAAEIGGAAGLDGRAYADLIRRLSSQRDPPPAA